MVGNKKIFMFDEDRSFLRFYQSLLAAKGYDVFATDNAYEFYLYAKDLHPDVLMVDLNQPQMSGWEIVDVLQEEPVLQETPIIISSVEANKERAEIRGLPFLPKPLAIEKLLEVLENPEAAKAEKVLIN